MTGGKPEGECFSENRNAPVGTEMAQRPAPGGRVGLLPVPCAEHRHRKQRGIFPSGRGEAGVAERSSGRTKRRAGSGAAALPMGPAAAQAAPASLGDLLPR